MSKERPEWIHGTNQGRVSVPMNGPGELGGDSGAAKGKAQIAMGVPVKLAMDDGNSGGYRAAAVAKKD